MKRPPDSRTGPVRFDAYRQLLSGVPAEWLWRAAAGIFLCVALLAAALALLSSAWWGLLCFVFLAVSVVCLVRSEPQEEVARPRARRRLTVRDVMTPNPMALSAEAPVTDAAEAMRDLDIGAVVVVDEGRALGIVTDRDIVVRAVAGDGAPAAATLGDICSRDLATVHADASTEDALDMMAARDVHRLPVTASRGAVVGIVSIGDLSRGPAAAAS